MAAPQQTIAAPVAFNIDVSPPKVASEFEVVEKEGAFDVTANMPGDENVRLGVTTDRVVHIVSDKKPAANQEGANNLDNQSAESESLRQRAVPLPENADETKVTASFKDGELYMNIPKRDSTATAQAAAVGAC